MTERIRVWKHCLCVVNDKAKGSAPTLRFRISTIFLSKSQIYGVSNFKYNDNDRLLSNNQTKAKGHYIVVLIALIAADNFFRMRRFLTHSFNESSTLYFVQ